MKAAIYARFSSDNQREESIMAQLRACREYCRQKGYVIVREYTDEAYSARTDDRPDFQRMISDARAGSFQVLICHKINRFSRDSFDDIYYKRILRKAEVGIEFVEQRIDDSPEGRLTERLLVGLAEYESENLAREVMKGLKENAYQARHNGGTPPLGFDVGPDGRYLINEGEAVIVRQIFEMRAAGLGYGRIIDDLNKKGHRTKSGGLFGKNSLHDLLKNKKYIGIYTFGRTSGGRKGSRNNHKNSDNIIEVPDAIPAVISMDIWERVQAQFRRSQRGPGTFKAKVNYLLSGLVRCECGSSMVGSGSMIKGHRYHYYRCVKNQQTKSCGSCGIRKEVLENIVLTYIRQAFQGDRQELLANIRQYLDEKNRAHEIETASLRKEKDAAHRKIENLLRLAEEGDVDDLVMGRIRDHKRRIAEIEAAIAGVMQDVDNYTDAEISQYLDALLSGNEKDPEELRAVFQKVVESVIVKTDDIEINLRFVFHGGDKPQHRKNKTLLRLRYVTKRQQLPA